MATKKTKAKKATTTSTRKKRARGILRTVNLQTHCEGVRDTLVALYSQSKSSTHPVVQGTLREGFMRQVLGGMLGRTTSWSSGQIVGLAPKNEVSGQMDLLLHDDLLPQVYMFDGALCLVPCGALFGVIEVKSNLTTGVGEKDVLTAALDSLFDAIKVSHGPASRAAFIVAAFYSGQKRGLIIKKIEDYLKRRSASAEQYWPDAVVVLSGGKAHAKGFGIFRTRLSNECGSEVKVSGLRDSVWLLDDGGSALAGLVALLSQRRIALSATADTFDFAQYIFRNPTPIALALPALLPAAP